MNEKKHKVCLRLSDVHYEHLKKQAGEVGVKIQEYLRLLVIQDIDFEKLEGK